MPWYAWVGIGVGAFVLLVLGRIFGVKIEAPPEAAKPIEPDGKSRKLEGTRYQEYRVGIRIEAPAAKVFALLTDASGFAVWNSTIVSLEGTLAVGQRIALKAKVAPERTFKLLVSEVDAPRRMVWEDGNRIFRGVRTFTLDEEGGVTTFTMAEAMTGAFLPQIAPQLPDFGPPFETFAADLKKAAEA